MPLNCVPGAESTSRSPALHAKTREQRSSGGRNRQPRGARACRPSMGREMPFFSCSFSHSPVPPPYQRRRALQRRRASRSSEGEDAHVCVCCVRGLGGGKALLKEAQGWFWMPAEFTKRKLPRTERSRRSKSGGGEKMEKKGRKKSLFFYLFDTKGKEAAASTFSLFLSSTRMNSPLTMMRSSSSGSLAACRRGGASSAPRSSTLGVCRRRQTHVPKRIGPVSALGQVRRF